MSRCIKCGLESGGDSEVCSWCYGMDLDTTETDQRIEALEARVEELKGILREIQWSYRNWRGYKCPVCLAYQNYRINPCGHKPNCRLRAALENT